MRGRLVWIFCFLLLGWQLSPAFAQAPEPAAPEEEPISDPSVVWSPQRTFRIAQRAHVNADGSEGEKFETVVVPAAEEDLSKGVVLEQGVDSTMARTYHISPDERWIYSEWKLYRKRCTGELFERKDGLSFVRVFPKAAETEGGSFDEALWDYFSSLTKLEHAEYPRLVDFNAWAADSSRLLVTIRGLASPLTKSGKVADTNKGVYDWKVYWNTATRTFEQTPMLKEHNLAAAKRWGSNVEYDSLFEPYAAEPAGAMPNVADLDETIAGLRAEIEKEWLGAERLEKAEAENRAGDAGATPWAEMEKRATAWRAKRITGADAMAKRWAVKVAPKQREQWRRLTLIGALRSAKAEVVTHQPWR